MLYSQIPRSIISHLESELKINLHLIGISFAKKQMDDTIYSKLQIVSEYINRNMKVGSIQTPSEYFSGTVFLTPLQKGCDKTHPNCTLLS